MPPDNEAAAPAGRPGAAASDERGLEAAAVDVEATRPTASPTLQTMRAAALSCAADGRSVFLLQQDTLPYPNCPECLTSCRSPESKAACPHPFCHGFLAATSDVAEIKARLLQKPNSLLAVRTGAVSGLVVLTADLRIDGRGRRRPGWETLRELSRRFPELRRTRWAWSDSGAAHLWLAHPGGIVPTIANASAGVELKGEDAHIVVPASFRPASVETPMAWPLVPMPPELPEMCRQPDPPDPPDPQH